MTYQCHYQEEEEEVCTHKGRIVAVAMRVVMVGCRQQVVKRVWHNEVGIFRDPLHYTPPPHLELIGHSLDQPISCPLHCYLVKQED